MKEIQYISSWLILRRIFIRLFLLLSLISAGASFLLGVGCSILNYLFLLNPTEDPFPDKCCLVFEWSLVSAAIFFLCLHQPKNKESGIDY